jgi:hypothetical protein
MTNDLRNGNRQEFNRALGENPKSVNGKGPGGWTPIMLAALYGDVEDVRHLLALGADPNAQNDGGGTALMYAVEDAEKTRLLLDHGADANARSGEGRTALLRRGPPRSNAVVSPWKGGERVGAASGWPGRATACRRDASLLSAAPDHGAGDDSSASRLLVVFRASTWGASARCARRSNAALTAARRAIRTTRCFSNGARCLTPNILQNVALSPNCFLRTVDTRRQANVDVRLWGTS